MEGFVVSALLIMVIIDVIAVIFSYGCYPIAQVDGGVFTKKIFYSGVQE